MVQKYLLELVSSSEVLERVAVGLIGTEAIYSLISDEVRSALASSRIKALVADAVKEAVKDEMGRVVIVVDDNDMLVIPSSGISSQEFDKLSSMIPANRRVGVIAADNVRILKLS